MHANVNLLSIYFNTLCYTINFIGKIVLCISDILRCHTYILFLIVLDFSDALDSVLFLLFLHMKCLMFALFFHTTVFKCFSQLINYYSWSPWPFICTYFILPVFRVLSWTLFLLSLCNLPQWYHKMMVGKKLAELTFSWLLHSFSNVTCSSS